MIYPKTIIDFVKSNSSLSNRFPEIASINTININELNLESRGFEFEQYMLEEGYLYSGAIRNYLFFITFMYDCFEDIYRYFQRENIQSTHKDDKFSVGTSPSELLYHAIYIYYLNSWEVKGDIIECGSFKGFSACCLSWVCHFLGKHLYVCDSFQGLPKNITDPYYKEGDFRGDLEDVQQNITDLGRIETVSFIKGFFADSLRDFNHPLCIIWMDVDLYESTMDILENIYSCLTPGSVIISHELFEERDFDNNKLLPTIGPSKALQHFFHENKINYLAKPLENGSGLIVPGRDDVSLLISRKHVEYLRENCRIHAIKNYEGLAGTDIQETASQTVTVEEILKSRSYRLGRAITAPYRILKKVFN